jgi:hypothetical protein
MLARIGVMPSIGIMSESHQRYRESARKSVEIANGVEAVQDGRIFIEPSMSRFSWLAAAASNSAPGSSAPLLLAGCGGTRTDRNTGA